MTFCWLIEVLYPKGCEDRSHHYFDGSCENGWHGNTTVDPYLARKYITKGEADRDIEKLAPRMFGEWVSLEHGFE